MVAHRYCRTQVQTLIERLSELPEHLIVIAGPRQVGKTTLVSDALAALGNRPYRYLAIDRPDALPAIGIGIATTETFTFEEDGRPRNAAWLIEQWKRARAAARESENGYVLVLD